MRAFPVAGRLQSPFHVLGFCVVFLQSQRNAGHLAGLLIRNTRRAALLGRKHGFANARGQACIRIQTARFARDMPGNKACRMTVRERERVRHDTAVDHGLRKARHGIQDNIPGS